MSDMRNKLSFSKSFANYLVKKPHTKNDWHLIIFNLVLSFKKGRQLAKKVTK